MKHKFRALSATDFYKTGHHKQYPAGTEYIYSNFTPRNSRLSNVPINGSFVCGVQYFVNELIELWNESFFRVPKEAVISHYRDRLERSLGVKLTGDSLKHISELHDLKHLPIEIRALPEGTFCPDGVPMMVIQNLRPDMFWLTNYLETYLSLMSWKPATSATTAAWFKKFLKENAALTNPEGDWIVPWQGHDFSMRGMSGLEDAAMSGMGHLLHFNGTDTIPAIDLIEDIYDSEIVAGSVPATEHSVMCSAGQDDELSTFRRIMNEVHPTGIVSIVSDTWDYWGVLTNHLPVLKDEIMARDGKVVIRPDSGDPVEIICGIEIPDATEAKNYLKSFAKDWIRDAVSEDTAHGESGDWEYTQYFRVEDKIFKAEAEIEWDRYDKQYYYIDGVRLNSLEEVELTAEQKGSIEVLWDLFGGTMSSTGFKVLDSHIGLIYGDSITPHRAWEIIRRLKDKGFASTNVVFGIGSFTYEYVTRDTHSFAMKATWAQINGQPIDIYKQPKTDSKKNSLKGRFKVVKDETDKLVVTTEDDPRADEFRHYYVEEPEDFNDIRARAEQELSKFDIVKPR